jgi:KipI family sensor histidine kinase inhibitor
MRIVPASDRSFLVVFGDTISREASRSVRTLHAWLRDDPCPGVVDLHPAYATLLVRFDPIRHDAAAIEQAIRDRASSVTDRPAPLAHAFSIPVHYGGDDAPDLDAVAAATGMSAAEVVREHAAASYEVAFLGFAPGFAYLLGLPACLTTPRRAAPRRSVPPGSVAIAGVQAGVYPLGTPGGWNLIGRTSVRLFDPGRPSASLLAPGDLVRFVPTETPA